MFPEAVCDGVVSVSRSPRRCSCKYRTYSGVAKGGNGGVYALELGSLLKSLFFSSAPSSFKRSCAEGIFCSSSKAHTNKLLLLPRVNETKKAKLYIRAALFKRPTRKGSVSVRSSTKDSLFFFLVWSVSVFLNE